MVLQSIKIALPVVIIIVMLSFKPLAATITILFPGLLVLLLLLFLLFQLGTNRWVKTTGLTYMVLQVELAAECFTTVGTFEVFLVKPGNTLFDILFWHACVHNSGLSLIM